MLKQKEIVDLATLNKAFTIDAGIFVMEVKLYSTELILRKL